MKALTCCVVTLQQQAPQCNGAPAPPPASAGSQSAVQPPAETAETSYEPECQTFKTHDQAADSKAAAKAPPVQHALPPLIQQLLSRTAKYSPPASAVTSAEKSSVQSQPSALPTPQEDASGGSAKPHGGTVSSMHASGAEVFMLPAPVEAAASISGIPEFGSISPQLGLAFALQSSSPRVSQPEPPFEQAHADSSEPGHHMTALPQPEASEVHSQKPMEEPNGPVRLPPPQAAYVSTAVKNLGRAAYRPMNQPGSLQHGAQENGTAHAAPTKTPVTAHQRPGSQPESMNGNAPESAPTPCRAERQSGRGEPDTQASGCFRTCAATCCTDCPTCSADGHLNSSLPDAHQTSAEDFQDEWHSQAAAQQQAAASRLQCLGWSFQASQWPGWTFLAGQWHASI